MPNFTASKIFGVWPLGIQFVDTSTESPITSWLWDFGDGNTSTEENPWHTYQDTGKYTVSLLINGTLRKTNTEYVEVVSTIDWHKWVKEHLPPFDQKFRTTEFEEFTRFLGKYLQNIHGNSIDLERLFDPDFCPDILLEYLADNLNIDYDIVRRVGISQSGDNYDIIDEYNIFEKILNNKASEDEIKALRDFIKNYAKMNQMKGSSNSIIEMLKYFGINSYIETLWTDKWNETSEVTDYFINGLQGADELGLTANYTSYNDNTGSLVENTTSIDIDCYSANPDSDLYYGLLSKNYNFKHQDMEMTVKFQFKIDDWEDQWNADHPKKILGIILRGQNDDIYDLSEYVNVELNETQVQANHVNTTVSESISGANIHLNYNSVYEYRVKVLNGNITVFLNDKEVASFNSVINDYVTDAGRFGFYVKNSIVEVLEVKLNNLDPTNNVFGFNDETREQDYYAKFPERMVTDEIKYDGAENYGQPYENTEYPIDDAVSTLGVSGAITKIRSGLNGAIFIQSGTQLMYKLNDSWNLFDKHINNYETSGHNLFIQIGTELRLYTLDVNEQNLYLNNAKFAESVDNFKIVDNNLYVY